MFLDIVLDNKSHKHVSTIQQAVNVLSYVCLRIKYM